MNKAEFVQRQHDEVRDLLGKLRAHADAFQEKLQETGKPETWQPLIEEAKAGVAALEPVLADYDNAGVDPEELIQYASTIEDWRMKEEELSKQRL